MSYADQSAGRTGESANERSEGSHHENSLSSSVLRLLKVPIMLGGIALASFHETARGDESMPLPAAPQSADPLQLEGCGAADFFQLRQVHLIKLLESAEASLAKGDKASLSREELAVDREFRTEWLRGWLQSSHPQSISEHLQWQRRMSVFRRYDPLGVDTEMRDLAVVRLSECLASFDRWKTEEKPLEKLDEYVREIYRLISFLPKNQTKLCAGQLANYQRCLAEDFKIESRAFVSESIKAADAIWTNKRAEEESSVALRLNCYAEAIRLIHKERYSDSKLFSLADYGFEKDGKWYIKVDSKRYGESAWQIALELNGYDGYVDLRNKDVPKGYIRIHAGSFVVACRQGRVGNLIDASIINRERDERGADKLAQWSLPTDKAVVYLPVFPKAYNEIIASNLLTSMLIGNALQHRFGEKVSVEVPLFVESAKESIAETLADYHVKYGSAPTCFFLDLFSHGSLKGGLMYEKPLTAMNLASFARRYSKDTFIFSSIACYQGGLVNGFSALSSLMPGSTDHVAVVVQTTSNLPGYVSTVKKDSNGKEHYRSTAYNNHLIEALYELPADKKLGSLIIFAQEGARDFRALDGQVFIAGEVLY